MKMKKLFAILLAALLVCTAAVCIAPRAQAAEDHTHCICGGNLDAHALQEHNAADGGCKAVTWTPIANVTEWNAMTVNTGVVSSTRRRFEGDVNVYLTGDVALTAILEVCDGQTVNLCLNGHTLTAPGGLRTCDIDVGTLNICDCVGGGKIVANRYCPTIFAFTLANLNLYGGTVTTTDYTQSGTWRYGMLYISREAFHTTTVGASHFAMYGGGVDGSHFTLNYAGQENIGGCIYGVGADTTVKIHGGTVTGANIAAAKSGSTYSKGAAVATKTSAEFTMTGGLIQGGKVPNGLGGNLYLVGQKNVISGGTVRGGSALLGGNIYAYGKLTVTGNARIEGGTATNNAGGIYCESCTLNVSGDAVITGAKATASGGALFTTGTCALNLSGNAKITDSSTDASGGILYANQGTNLTMQGNAEISGGSAKSNGGNLFLPCPTTASAKSTCTVTMSDSAVIKNGTAANEGGNVYSGTKTDLILKDSACLLGGTATGNGGNVRLAFDSAQCCSNVTLSGNARIEGGTSKSGNGGSLFVSGSKVTMNENAFIGGSDTFPASASNGAAVYMVYGNAGLTVNGGTVSGGTATGNGGTIYQDNGVLTVNGGTILGGKAANGGAVYQGVNGVMTLKNAAVQGGVATAKGGNLYLTGTSTVTGCTVRDGKATGNGGNVYLMGTTVSNAFKNTAFTLTDSTVTGGTAAHGQGIAIEQGVVTLTGNTVVDSAKEDIYLDNARVVNWKLETLNTSGVTSGDTMTVAMGVSGTFASESETKAGLFRAVSGSGLKVSTYDGRVYLTAADSVTVRDKNDAVKGTYATIAEAAAHAAGDGSQYVRMERTVQDIFRVTGKDLYLDINGTNLRGQITLDEGKKICGMDTGNNNYATRPNDDNGRFLFADVVGGTVAPSTKAPNAKRYLATAIPGTSLGNVNYTRYAFDRFYVGMVAVALNPYTGEAGFTGVAAGNANVKNALAADGNAYGFRIRLDGSEETVEVGLGKADFSSGSQGNRKRVSVQHQLEAVNEYPELAETDVIASAFITLATGETVESAEYRYNMREMFELADTQFDTLTVAQKRALQAMYQEYEIMQKWNVPNMANYEFTELTMRYDDRIALSELGIRSTPEIKTVSVTSKTVAGAADTAVLTCADGKLYATAVGTADMTVDGVTCRVTVEPAPISLMMITGHSVGAGEKGDPAQSVVCREGMAYSSYEGNTARCLTTSAITENTGLGAFAASRPAEIDALTLGSGVTGAPGGIAAKWNELTGEKIWMLNAAKGGSMLGNWTADGALYQHAVELFRNAEQILAKEIQAGHYTLSHMAIINNCCANGDQYWEPDVYYNAITALWNGFKTDLAYDMDGDGNTETVEAFGMCPIWTVEVPASALKMFNGKKVCFTLTGTADYPEIFLANPQTRNWVTDEGIVDFFTADKVKYTTHSGTPLTPPATTAQVYADKVHFLQVAYNAAGMDIGENLYRHFYGEPTTAQLALYGMDGKTDIGNSVTTAANTPVCAVMVCTTQPVSGITVETTEGITYAFGDIIAARSGTVTFRLGDQILRTVQVTVK